MGGSRRTDQRVGPDVVPDKTRTAFLDIARGLAAILVVYTHIYDVYIRSFKDVRTPATDAIDTTFVIPLKLDDQGLGAISVPIFFIISGFVVTPIALKMGAGRFSVNRLFRIYPLLIFVVALSALLIVLNHPVLSTKPQPVNVWTFLSNASLWNFIDRPFGAWVGVSWTLAVEILFYGTLVAVLPLLRRRMWLAIAVQLWFVLMLLITYRAFIDEYRALVINMVYVLIPIMGQAIWAAWTGRIPAWLAGLFVTAAWLMFVWAGHLGIDPDYIPRPFPIAFALMLFLIGLFAEPYLRQRRFWTELSERTYSIYLLHGSVAFPLMHLLFDQLPIWLTVLIAVVATGLVAELSYRFVERPSHNLARRLSKRGGVKPVEPEPEPEEESSAEPVAESEEESPTETTRPVAPPPRQPPPRVPMPPPAARPHRDIQQPARRVSPRKLEQDDQPTERHEPVIVENMNGSLEHAWSEPEDTPAPARNGHATNGHATNGVPRADRAVPAGARRATASVEWPEEQDDPDVRKPGRHRRD